MEEYNGYIKKAEKLKNLKQSILINIKNIYDTTMKEEKL